MGLTFGRFARGLAGALVLLGAGAASVSAAVATGSTPAGGAPHAAAARTEPCLTCPDSLRVEDGTPNVSFYGTLSRDGGKVVLDGCAGRLTLEDVMSESVTPLVGRKAWVNGLCTGKGRIAAMGGHALGDSVVDVFVMSLCPFGRALERQMAADLAHADSLPIPAVRVHWIVYAEDGPQGQVYGSRHGEKELLEDVVQMTIREMEPDKFWPYLALRSTSDTTWTALASRVGLGWRTLTEVQ